MIIAFPANKRVVVPHSGQFYDCIVFAIEDKISVELTDVDVIISFGDEKFHKDFIDIPNDMDDIVYVLVDATQDRSKQIIGIAETDSFDESQPGRVYLLR